MAGEELINRALAIDPKQPLALHLHIHIAEESSPQRCVLTNCPCGDDSMPLLAVSTQSALGPWRPCD